MHFQLIKAVFSISASLSASLSDEQGLQKDDDMPDVPPYKLARLANQDKPISTDTNQRWYIIYYAWDAVNGVLKKKRDYSVNKFQSKKERLAYAKKRIAAINQLLAEGYHISAKKPAPAEKKATVLYNLDYTVENAFDTILPVIKAMHRKTTYDGRLSASKLFLEFCKENKWLKYKVTSINRNDVIAWLDHRQVNHGNSNTTRNNNLNNLRSVFSAMVAKGMLKENPVKDIAREKETESTRTAYQRDQIDKLKEAITASEPRLWIFIQFLFYGFIRPKEIGLLRVKNIDLVNNTIYIPGEISKNKRSSFVKISPAFRTYILQLELHLFDPEYFVFGRELETGPIPLPRNRAYVKFKKYLVDLKFGKGYDLYTWKHTGVIFHYRAGVDIKNLQRQLRHASLDETDGYMRSLGLFDNKDFEDKSPVI